MNPSVLALANEISDNWWKHTPPQQSPYHHQYHKAIVYKILLGSKVGTVLHLNCEQALELIREVHKITRGLKQIVYLVGWQFDGHDSKYPSWSEVNGRLKGENDESAQAAVITLMGEAAAYNATVSLHINMNDAYENSPLWQTYLENDLLVRDEKGELIKGDIWGGEQCYTICMKSEWEKGFVKKRIDSLLQMLPIAKAGTIHIDAFRPIENPYLHYSRDEQYRIGVKILQYWRSLGVDVTTEWFHHEFAGYTPMALHINMDESSRLTYPPDVICGGGSAWNKRHFYNHEKVMWAGGFGTPEAGCLYDEAWGQSFAIDLRSRADLLTFKDRFFQCTVPWLFLNQHRSVEHVHTGTRYEVRFSSEIISRIDLKTSTHSIYQHGNCLKESGDYCLPAVWMENTLVAYSQHGGQRKWMIDEDWEKVTLLSNTNASSTMSPHKGELTLNLQPGEVVWISKAAGKTQRSQSRRLVHQG